MITVTVAGVRRDELEWAIRRLHRRIDQGDLPSERQLIKLLALKLTAPLDFGRPVRTGEHGVITPALRGVTRGDDPAATGDYPGDHPESGVKTRWGKTS